MVYGVCTSPRPGVGSMPSPYQPPTGDSTSWRRKVERGCGDTCAARPGGSSTGESGDETDNELLKMEATWPAHQPADDGARRRQGATY